MPEPDGIGVGFVDPGGVQAVKLVKQPRETRT
jgi:hypothetical protein